MLGIDIRKKYSEELELINSISDNVIKNKTIAINIEHIHSLDSNVKIDEADETRFSLFKPESLFEKKHAANASYLSITVDEKRPLLILNPLNSNIHINMSIKKNASCDILFILPYQSKSLVVEAFLEDDSFARITTMSSNGELMTRYFAKCNNNSRLEAINFSTSSIDSSSKITLEDDASSLIVNSYFNKESQSKSNDVIIHNGKNTNSLITSKGYLLNSKSDFRGLIKIEPPAFNAQGYQESAVLLEGSSKAISIPDLEISNNEVKCSHGSTISRIKDEDLFYFESRGISKEQARLLLIKAHLFSVLPDVSEIKGFAEKILEGVMK